MVTVLWFAHHAADIIQQCLGHMWHFSSQITIHAAADIVQKSMSEVIQALQEGRITLRELYCPFSCAWPRQSLKKQSLHWSKALRISARLVQQELLLTKHLRWHEEGFKTSCRECGISLIVFYTHRVQTDHRLPVPGLHKADELLKPAQVEGTIISSFKDTDETL